VYQFRYDAANQLTAATQRRGVSLYVAPIKESGHLARFLADWDLQTRDAEITANAQRLAEEGAVKKGLAILVDQLGHSEEEAFKISKSTGRFRTYFADK